MKILLRVIPIFVLIVFGCALQRKARVTEHASPYGQWPMGPSADPSFFPLAVWLQDPELAGQYKKAGINTYVGLWRGPTEKQLAMLHNAGMKVICQQNETGLRHLNDSLIIGWLQNDEPDNAQPLSDGEGYGPPIHPAKVISDYRKLKEEDPSRPVLLNLGQGVAWDNWEGRGVRTGHPGDYPEYIKGGDIISFDIYPAAHSHEEVAGKLWYVAKGVDRLSEWSNENQVIWNCLETTHISNPSVKINPRQLRSEVWMSIIHGSRGFIYFVHEFEPAFNASALLDDPEMLSAVTALNREITELAPVLNRPSSREAAEVLSSNPEMPVATMLKQYKGATYLFTAGLQGDTTTATFMLKAFPSTAKVTVLGENRNIVLSGGAFEDKFQPWDVHLYRIDN